MQSFIIVGSDQDAQTYLSSFYEEKGIDVFDRMIVTPQETSFGIAQVRKIQEVLYLKPAKGKTKIVVIEKADTATNEAQNALLKILEEPPPSTFIFLIAKTLDRFLPTVLSRCTVIKIKPVIKTDAIDIKPTHQLAFHPWGVKLKNGSISEKLKTAQDISKDKEEALSFLESVILSLRTSLLKGEGDLSAIKKLQYTHTLLHTTNVNVRLALESLFLSL